MAAPSLTSAQADFIVKFLGVTIPDHAMPAREGEEAQEGNTDEGLSLVGLGKARLAWATHHNRMHSEINRLKGAVRQAYSSAPEHEAAVNAGLGRLDGALAQFSDELADQLDAVLNESDPGRRDVLSGKATKTTNGFLAFCDADPVMSGIDGNEFVPDMNIVGPAQLRLRDIKTALGQ